MKNKQFNAGKRQKGNYLLSIAIGLMILAILAVFAIPKIKTYLVEGAVPSVAEEVQRFVSRMQISTQGGGTTPYTGMTQASLARSVKGTALTVADDGSTVTHGLGGGTNGTVVLAETGSEFTLTFNSVSVDACPGLAGALQRSVQDISINGTSVQVTDSSNNITTAYSSPVAQTRCVDGDNNTFIFTIR